MADILIRMEMPKEPTPLTLYPDGRWNDYTDGANGEFLPLPEGHGRLIDAEAIMTNIGEVPYKGSVRRVLMSAPTIVPAEGGTDNGN